MLASASGALAVAQSSLGMREMSHPVVASQLHSWLVALQSLPAPDVTHGHIQSAVPAAPRQCQCERPCLQPPNRLGHQLPVQSRDGSCRPRQARVH